MVSKAQNGYELLRKKKKTLMRGQNYINCHRLYARTHTDETSMATINKSSFPLFPSMKQILPSRSLWISCKPISDSTTTLPLSHFTRQQGQLAVSVAFDPSGKFDLSLFEDEDGNNLASLCFGISHLAVFVSMQLQLLYWYTIGALTVFNLLLFYLKEPS